MSTKNLSPDGLVWKAKIPFLADVGSGYFKSRIFYIGLPFYISVTACSSTRGFCCEYVFKTSFY